MSDLRERVARVLAEFQGEIHDGTWRFYLKDADAAIALVLEEAAKECDKISMDDFTMLGRDHMAWMRATATDCAAAIRALKGKP